MWPTEEANSLRTCLDGDCFHITQKPRQPIGSVSDSLPAWSINKVSTFLTGLEFTSFLLFPVNLPLNTTDRRFERCRKQYKLNPKLLPLKVEATILPSSVGTSSIPPLNLACPVGCQWLEERQLVLFLAPIWLIYEPSECCQQTRRIYTGI